MRIIQAALVALALQASNRIVNLTKQDNGTHKAPVCIACDILLDTDSFDKIQISTLRKNISRLQSKHEIPHDLVSQYQRQGNDYQHWMHGALLSSKATYYKPE